MEAKQVGWTRRAPQRVALALVAAAAICLPSAARAQAAKPEAPPSAGASAAPADPAKDAYPDPEDGTLADGVYRNPYFKLSYPLPPGWGEGLKGPPPGYNGYYVLNAPRPKDGSKATMLIGAQDMFFSVKPMATALETLQDLAKTASPQNGLHVDEPAAEVKIGGHPFAKLEMIAAPELLSRLVFATDVRCHVIIYSLASADRDLLHRLAASLEKMSLPAEASATGAGSSADGADFPVCVNDYAKGDNVIKEVDPEPTPPFFLSIPVRVVIGTDGKVKHIHVIRAFPAQKKSIEEALVQWEFKPYQHDGKPVELETGLIFEFKPPKGKDKDKTTR